MHYLGSSQFSVTFILKIYIMSRLNIFKQFDEGAKRKLRLFREITPHLLRL